MRVQNCWRNAKFANAVVVWAVLLIGNVRPVDAQTTREVGRPVEESASVISDTGGPIAEIVIHYTLDSAIDVAATYADLFTALPPDVNLQVLCPTSIDVDAFLVRWGAVASANGRSVRVINVNRPITIWARDRRISRQVNVTGAPAITFVPACVPEYEESKIGELVSPHVLAASHVIPGARTIRLHIEGGNFVSNNRHVFVGANVFDENADVFSDRGEIDQELSDTFGRPYIVLSDDDGDVPWCHVDMYLTPIDDETVLIASPALARVHFDACETDDESAVSNKVLLDFDDLASAGDPGIDAVARQLREAGYRVIHMPALMDRESDWMITYNNVLMERRDGKRIVYMPTYQISKLDEPATRIYEALGFEVHGIDVVGIYVDGGAIRCLTNVTSRRPVGAMTTTAPAASVDQAVLSDDVADSQTAASPSWLHLDTLADVPLLLPILIFLARILDVSIGTIRLICVTRGNRLLAVVLAFAEVVIWTLAFATVMKHLDNWANVLAFAFGFTAGNAVGMWIEQRLALGTQTVNLISRTKGQQLADRIREMGAPLTMLKGVGHDGPVDLCLLYVPRRRTEEIVKLARSIDPDVVVTIEDVRKIVSVRPGASAAAVASPCQNLESPSENENIAVTLPITDWAEPQQSMPPSRDDKPRQHTA